MRNRSELLPGFRSHFGKANLVEEKPSMGGEDFGEYGRTEHKIPICMFGIGTVKREQCERSRRTGKPLPGLHSSLVAPDSEPTLETGITAGTVAARELMGKK